MKIAQARKGCGYAKGIEGRQTEAGGKECQRGGLAVLGEKLASAKIDPTTLLSRPAQAAPPCSSRRNENLTSLSRPVKDGRARTAVLPGIRFSLDRLELRQL
jgi:hypothetical protein